MFTLIAHTLRAQRSLATQLNGVAMRSAAISRHALRCTPRRSCWILPVFILLKLDGILPHTAMPLFQVMAERYLHPASNGSLLEKE